MQKQNLSEIYAKYSTPEGNGDKGTAHSYIENYYSKKFSNLRNLKLNILEIGVANGNSLEMWAEYFPFSQIYGIDIKNISYKPSNSRINVIIGDATDQETFKNLNRFHIVIDDGSHAITDQVLSYAVLFHRLIKNGIYIIEDVKDIDLNYQVFKKLHHTAMIYDFRKIKNRDDDVIVEIINK